MPLRPHELLGLDQRPAAICVLPDSAVVLEEGAPDEASLLPPELEDFEATLGTDRRCRHTETYSRVSIAGHQSRWPEVPMGSLHLGSEPRLLSDLSLSHWVWEAGETEAGAEVEGRAKAGATAKG